MKDGFNVIEQMEVPSNFDHLSQVESLIDRTCNSCGVNEDSYGNVLIAVTEAFNNAIVHGNKMNDKLDVKVKVSKKEEELCFTICDNGVGFDFENIADTT